MTLPEGIDEKAAYAAIDYAASLLSHRFTVPGYSLDDIRQEARLFGLNCLSKYDSSKGPLENYVWVSIKFRLQNLVRDKSKMRPLSDSPCRKCADGIPCRPEGNCQAYTKWYKRQTSRANVAHPLPLTHDGNNQNFVDNENHEEDIELREIVDIVSRELPIDMLDDWAKLRRGGLGQDRRINIEDEILRILRRHGISATDLWSSGPIPGPVRGRCR